MVLPVRMRNHCGICRFCFPFFARIFFTRKVLLHGMLRARAMAEELWEPAHAHTMRSDLEQESSKCAERAPVVGRSGSLGPES